MSFSCCPLFLPEKKSMKMLLIVHIMIVIIFLTIQIYTNMMLLLTSDKKIMNAFAIKRIFDRAACILFIFIFWKNRKTLRNIIFKCIPMLSRQDMRKVRKFNGLLVVSWTIHICLSVVVTVCSEIIARYFEEFTFNYASIVRLYLCPQTWTSTILCIFLSISHVIHLTELTYYTKLLVHLREPIKIERCLKYFVELKDSLMETLSVTPCLPFLFLLIRSITSLIWVRKAEEEVSSQGSLSVVRSYVFLSKFHLSTVSIIFFDIGYSCYTISKRNRERRRVLEALETAIKESQNELTPSWLSVLMKIDHVKLYEFRAWDLFSIKKSLMLCFCCSFVTFTVLFVQLIS